MKTTAVANQKGGVGKSFVGGHLAHFISGRIHRRTLAIDIDHQGNLTKPLRGSGKAAVTNFTSSALFHHSWADLQKQGATIPEGDLVLIPSDDDLMLLERQPDKHNRFATNFRNFILSQGESFAACIVDTNPNPDIRLVTALCSSDYVLSPIQLNQEAIDGIAALLTHHRVGVKKIRATLNPKLELIGLLPNLVEGTPFQKKNFADIVTNYAGLLIPIQTAQPKIDPETGRPLVRFAFVPKRSAIAEAQASGERLWEMAKSAARDTWREIEPTFAAIASRMKVELQ